MLACKQALHLGDIIKSRHGRGDVKARRGEKGPLQFHCLLVHSRVALFAHLNRRACWQADKKPHNECQLEYPLH